MRIFRGEEQEPVEKMRPSSRGQYDEESPLLITPNYSAPANASESKRQLSASFKMASAVAFVFSLFLITMGVAVYENNDENSMKIRADMFQLTPESEQTQPSSSSSSPSLSSYLPSCSINSEVATSCRHITTKFVVDATEAGEWPHGFSWTVLKDSSVEGSQNDKMFLHSENGNYFSKDKDVIKCQKFVTELCLAGNYVVYANSEDSATVDAAVSVCGKKVVVDEALDFSADHVQCLSSNFELDPDYNRYKTNVEEAPASILAAIPHSMSLSYDIPPASSAPTPLFQKFLPPPPSYEPSAAPSGPSPMPTQISEFRFNFTSAIEPVVEIYNETITEAPILYNETINGFQYPTLAPTISPSPEPTASLTNATTGCWAFGLICERDFEKVGWTGAPSTMPSSVPTMINGEPMPPKSASCAMFGLFCQTETVAPSPEPTVIPALRTIDLKVVTAQEDVELHRSYRKNVKSLKK